MRKIFYLISSFVALIFLAIAFQNFSLQPQPMEISKDQKELISNLETAIEISEQDHAEKHSETLKRPEPSTSGGGRTINSLEHNPGDVYEGGPVSVDLNDVSIKK